MCALRAVSAVERHLAAAAADVDAAKRSALDWQTRCETAAVHTATQVDTCSPTSSLALRQQLEDSHRSELEELANSCQLQYHLLDVIE